MKDPGRHWEGLCSTGHHPAGSAGRAPMLFAVLYLALGTLAAACQPDEDHVATCQVNKCEMVDSTEICTQCKAGGVPIDGFCWPFSSPRVITAGCTKEDGADLDSTANTCRRCSGADHFLFMGGCYNQKVGIGGTICTAASGGECNTCAKAGWLFENPAESPAPGTKCILCSDTVGDGKTMGIANCNACTAPRATGAATCVTCRPGYVKDQAKNECKKCGSGCSECSESNPSQCSACEDGNYLNTNTCAAVDGCGGDRYADPTTGQCKPCNGITDCETCEYDEAKGKVKCKTCGSSKIPRTAMDGTSTCVTKDYAGCTGANKDLFMKEDKTCVLCSTVSVGADPNDQGIAGCKKCTKESATPPTCSECLDGYYDSGNGAPATCVACGENCATCVKDTKDLCTTCKSGFFMKGNGPGECLPCDGEGGAEGCGICTGGTSFTCNSCKPNYRQTGARSGSVTCTKVCEDETACGGTAGACDATVVDENGTTKHYCSFCGESGKFPIDGKCTNVNAGNDGCANGVCKSCTTGYFLYMGGCYSTANPPGNLMCKTANGGICTEAASDKYFAVPDAAKTDQSVLACGNPLGTAVGEKTYVGVEGCSQCTAPAQLEASGMAAATCTACGEGRKPSKSGTGCAACSDANCRHCRVDGVCEECSSGFNLEGGKCVSTGGPNLSTGAIAGISVAVVVVVGGLVGFLCWWFICRGKA